MENNSNGKFTVNLVCSTYFGCFYVESHTWNKNQCSSVVFWILHMLRNQAFRLANIHMLSFLVSLHSDKQQHFLSEIYLLSGLLQSSQCGGMYVTVTHFQVEI